MTAKPLYEDATTCGLCEQPGASRRVISTGVRGTKPVPVIDCPRCDHTVCKPCGKPVANRKSPFCPAGHPLNFTA